MAYTKQTWINKGTPGATPLSADRLNYMEDGIEAAAAVADAALPTAGGTMTGDLTLAGDPTDPLHAATKQYVDAAVGGVTGDFLLAANDLNDLNDPASARNNLGLGDAATLDVGTTAGTVAAGDDSRITGALQASSNLSDVANAATARSNLGLGALATKSTIANADIADDAAIALTKLATNPLDRSNHTGTQSVSTLSDFDAAVEAKALDELTAPTTPLALAGLTSSDDVTLTEESSGAGRVIHGVHADGIPTFGLTPLKLLASADEGNVDLVSVRLGEVLGTPSVQMYDETNTRVLGAFYGGVVGSAHLDVQDQIKVFRKSGQTVDTLGVWDADTAALIWKITAEGHMVMREQSVNPTLTSGVQSAIYMKDDKLVVAYNHNGTVKYRYLDLTTTDATWTYTTTAP